MAETLRSWQFWATTIPCSAAILWYWLVVLGRRR